MIRTSRVFWIEYKLLHNIPTQHDVSEHNETVHRELRNFSSPFCAFVIAKENNEKKLKPVACQMDFSSGILNTSAWRSVSVQPHVFLT